MHLGGFFLFISIIYLQLCMVIADEDDNYGLLLDFAAGASVAACEKDEQCSEMMPILTLLSFAIVLIVNICECVSPPKKHQKIGMKNIMATGAGYGFGKLSFNK